MVGGFLDFFCGRVYGFLLSACSFLLAGFCIIAVGFWLFTVEGLRARLARRRKKRFPTVSKRSTVAPVNVVFGNDPTVSKKRLPTVNSPPTHHHNHHNHHNYHTCSRYLRPLYNVTEKYSTSTQSPHANLLTILATARALEYRRTIQRLHSSPHPTFHTSTA